MVCVEVQNAVSFSQSCFRCVNEPGSLVRRTKLIPQEVPWDAVHIQSQFSIH